MSQTLTADLAAALRISVMRLGRRLRYARADTMLSTSQLATLATLDRLGPMTPGELAAQERVQPPSMTRIIASLEQHALVTRTAHPSDRRQAIVAISKAGRALLGEDRRRRTAWLAQRIRSLSAEEVEVLRRATPILDKLASS